MKKLLECVVEFPDGEHFSGELEKNTLGWVLLDNACKFAKISETDLFGLTYKVDGEKFWLNIDKSLSKQLKGSRLLFTFSVKYYVPQPSVIKNEMTRYYLFLQLRTDILMNRLPCSFVSLALLGSYVAQSQIGDYQEEVHGQGSNYIRSVQFCSSPTNEILEKIAELHRTHCGMQPIEAEMNFLENAKSLSLYGVHMHPVRDVNGIEMSIGVYSSGILVYLDKLRVNRFVWVRIVTLTRKGNQFVIQLRPSEIKSKEEKVVFKLETSKKAKQLWQLAVDHHLFFRVKEAYSSTELPFRPFTLNRTSLKSFDGEGSHASVIRTPRNKIVGPVRVEKRPAALSSRLKSTDRLEEHVGGWQPNNTVDVVRDMSSLRSWSPEEGEDSYEGGGAYPLQQQQQMHSQEPQIHQACDSFMNEAMAAVNNGYEPCGNYLSREKSNPLAFRRPEYGEPFPCDLDSVKDPYYDHKQLQGRFSYCQHRDISQHESPKMIFQDQCHHTCSCDQIWETQDQWDDRDKAGRSSRKESKRMYVTPQGTRVTEFKVQGDGVVETYIERRSKRLNSYEDMMLSEAIQQETGMDDNLRVERIEINTDISEQ